MNAISIIMAIIFIIGLLTLAVLWGILFKIGLRTLLPFRIKHLKTEAHYCLLSCIFTFASFCATTVTIFGAIFITKLVFFI